MAKASKSGKKSSTKPARKGAARAKKPARPAKATKSAKSAKPASARVPFFQVDAFTSRPHHGNPAGVVVLSKFPSDDAMQAIAAEHNLPATAFIVPAGSASGPKWKIRWFSPAVEIKLCGHGTLAAAHVVWNHLKVAGRKIAFQSGAGPLDVTRDGDRIVLDFPARETTKVAMSDILGVALGRHPAELYKSTDYLAVFDNKRDVHELTPDFHAMERLDANVTVTAPAAGHDFVSRHFAPRLGLNEDHATGSSHCTLVPFWAGRLRKTKLSAHQVSHRGGEMFCELKGKRVAIGGHAVSYLEGKIAVPA